MTLLKFKSESDERFCVFQKQMEHMLSSMIRDGLTWYEANDRDHDFTEVISSMGTNGIANAIEQCTADEVAVFLQSLAGIIADEAK